MIVPMQKVSLIVPADDSKKVVDTLADLALMHVDDIDGATSDVRSALEGQINEISRFKNILGSLKLDENGKKSDKIGKELFNAISVALDEQNGINQSLEQYIRWGKEYQVWGNFDFSQIEKMRERGLYLYLCSATVKELADLEEQGFICQELKEPSGKTRYFVVVSEQEIEAGVLPEFKFSSTLSLDELEGKVLQLRKAQAQNLEVLKSYAKQSEALELFQASVQSELDFIIVQESVATSGKLAAVSGFVPNPEMAKLKERAKAQGWGLYFRDADPDTELVPTLLKQSKISRMINPLLDFLSISPGYNEFDISIPVLLFFTIFFGILAGDAGYGLIFLAISGTFLVLKRENKTLRLALSLMVLLSCASIAWGAMTANWFGMELLPGIPFLTEEPNKDRNVQLVCFSLALVHLSSARLWRIFTCNWNWRHILGNTGWLIVLAGNFLLVMNLLLFPGKIPSGILVSCYVVGILMIAIGDINWRDVGSIFGFPFEVVSSFVDVLSYIRLFAVGLAGYYLAVCFNDMAAPMFEGNILMIAVGVILLLFGHILNIALAALGVLVHGVRLNTLEYANHLGLRWAGFVFKPFKKNK